LTNPLAYGMSLTLARQFETQHTQGVGGTARHIDMLHNHTPWSAPMHISRGEGKGTQQLELQSHPCVFWFIDGCRDRLHLNARLVEEQGRSMVYMSTCPLGGVRGCVGDPRCVLSVPLPQGRCSGRSIDDGMERAGHNRE